MRTKYIFTIFVLSLLGISCDDYLDIVPKEKFIPTTCEDYENMLNDANVLNLGDYFQDLLTDDAFLPEGEPGNLYSKQTLSSRRIYTFNMEPYGEADNDFEWSQGYLRMFYYNSVINNIMNSSGSDNKHKASVKAEALLMRSIEYFYLINLYAKQYDAATAATDPGVPLVLEADINGKHKRNSVEEVYTQMIKDLEEAIKSLPSKSSLTKFRGCKAGGLAMLARVYLNMDKYEEALEYADLALEEYDVLDDMNNRKIISPGPFEGVPGNPLGWTDIPDGQHHPESLVSRHYLRPFGLGMDVCASVELSQLFNDDDTRWNLFYANCWPPYPPDLHYSTRYGVKIYLRGDYYNNALSTPEVYLIRAECKARANDLQGALDDVNKLRKNRIKPTAYHEYTKEDFNNNTELVLRFVLEERRRELAFKGMRHIDLKRLNKDPRFAKTITHVAEGVTYMLEPNSPKYLRQIWPAASKFNPDWPLNPEE